MDKATTTTPPFTGAEVTLGGTVYVVPPLSLGALRRLMPTILSLGDATDTDTMIASAIAVCGAALRRNYPELTDDALSEIMDVGNMSMLVEAVLAQSGLAKSPASVSASGDASGNAVAGSMT